MARNDWLFYVGLSLLSFGLIGIALLIPSFVYH